MYSRPFRPSTSGPFWGPPYRPMTGQWPPMRASCAIYNQGPGENEVDIKIGKDGLKREINFNSDHVLEFVGGGSE